MTNEQLKPIIDEILKDYFNRATRLGYNTKTQKDMIAQNRGLCKVRARQKNREFAIGL